MTFYIGKEPTIGNYAKMDSISAVNGQATYNLLKGGVAFAPQSANHVICSLNSIIQNPGSSFTISGSQITFASNLVTGDSIDFILVLGDVLSIGTPSDDTIDSGKLKTDSVVEAKIQNNAVTTDKINNDAVTIDKINLISTTSAPSLEAKGTSGQTDGYIQLNCEQNSHRIKLKSTSHSSSQSYTIIMPDNQIAQNKFMKVKSITGSGSTAVGQLEFADQSSGGAISSSMVTISGAQTTTSTSFVSVGSGLSISVTPASTSSKFLLLFSSGVYGDYLHVSFFRGSTNLITDNTSTASTLGYEGGSQWGNMGISFLDSPNTTSSTTYEVKFRSSNGNTVYINDGASYLATFTLIEL